VAVLDLNQEGRGATQPPKLTRADDVEHEERSHREERDQAGDVAEVSEQCEQDAAS
jgi:hypothetical protein